jgi:hypothetical protein
MIVSSCSSPDMGTQNDPHVATGFLVPCDGDVSNLASLIRWDDLTRGADLIEAKHILFLMDACYGGLALNRAVALVACAS